MLPRSCLRHSRRGAARIAAAAWLSALGACAGLAPPPVRVSPLDVPAAWSGGTTAPQRDAGALAHWWLRFDDPLLAQLVSQALQANTEVAGAQAALRQARALRDVAAAGLGPTLGSAASAQRSRSNGNTGDSFRAGLDASWEPDVFGAKRSALDASEAVAGARAAALGDVQVSTAAEVALAYIALRGTQARLAIANDNLAGQQETLQLTQWRMQAGLLSSLEGEQARAAAEQTRAQLPALRSSIEQSAHALAVLTGQAPAALLAALSPARPVPQPAGDLLLAIPADTLRQRPDVRAAEFQASAALARVAQADAARLPSFRLSGNLGLSALTLGGLGSGAALAGAVLASVSLPLLDGGAALAQVRAQQAALEQADVLYQAAVSKALKEVEDALVALRADGERLAHLQDAATAAANAAWLARQRYSSGLVDFQIVLETQRNQRNAQDSVVAARADLSADHVRLYKALGGGWRSDGGDPVAAVSALPAPRP